MKKLAAVLALGVLFIDAQAEEPPHLEFVQKLRASHYPDLALEYLQKISKTVPPDIRPIIDLEIAKTHLEVARTEPDPGKKPGLFGQARDGFEAFLKNNPNSPQASEAKLEITSIAVLQGKSQLQKVLRQPSGPTKQAEAVKARAALDDAVKQLEVGIKELDLRLVKYDDAKTKQELDEKKALEAAKSKAALERGVLLLDEATTFLGTDNTDVNKQRAEVVKQARAVLEKTAAAADTRTPIHWQAQAWICKCIHEDGDSPAARTRLEKIINVTASSANLPGIEAGKRLAYYFLIQIAPDTPQAKKDAIREQYELAQTWIKNFPRDLDTPEGQHVRFLLGEACVGLARATPKDKPQQAADFYAQAEKLFKELEGRDNEFTDRARSQRANVVFTRTGGEKTKISDLATFDACYIRALYEVSQMEKDAKETKDAAALEKKRKDRSDNIVAALQQGLRLVENKRAKATETDLNSATAMLVYSCLTGGKYTEAIKLGEKMTREKPFAIQASAVAMYTLQAYVQLLGPDSKLSDEQEEEYRKKMEALAKDITNRWPDDAAADMAHFQMGLLNIRDKKYPEAVEQLAQVKPTFGAAIHAQYHLANTAFQVAKDKSAEKDKAAGPDKARLDKEEQSYKDRAVKALGTIPNLPVGADPATNQLFIYAKVRYGQHLFTVKKFDDMERLAEPLLKRLPELRLADEAAREQAQASLTGLTLYAAYGKADAEFAAGRPAQAGAILDKIVERIKAGTLPELKKDPQLRGGILGLALRGALQEGKLDRAKEILQVMLASADTPQEADLGAILPLLSNLMKSHLDEIRKKDDKAALEKATAGFTGFLDELAKGQKEGGSPEFTRALAQGYANLDQWTKVIELVSKVEEPKGKDAEPRLVQNCHACRLLLVRAYRQSNQLDDAEKILKEVLGSWGKNNLDVQFERIHLFDARGKHGAAATEWNKLSKQLVSRIKEADIKPRYFECYFYLCRSLYWHGVKEKDPKYIKQAAAMIAKLENAWPDFGGEASKARFLDLLTQEKELKDQYIAQKPDK